MQNFKNFYFLYNKKKIIERKKGKKSFLSFFLELFPKKKIRNKKIKKTLYRKIQFKKPQRKIKNHKYFRLGLVYFFCFLFFFPLFSLLSNGFNQINNTIIQNHKTINTNQENLPEIVVIDAEKDKQIVITQQTNNSPFTDKIFKKNEFENSESPNTFISEDKIGDFLDEDSQQKTVAINPLVPNQEIKDFIQEAKKRTPYKIKNGDNLWTIAKKYNVSLDAIISLNKIKTPHQLQPGNIINIPNISGVYYEVKKGDSLSRLSKKYNVTYEEIKKYNALGSFLNVGEELLLPQAKLTTFERNLIFGKLFNKPVSGKLTSKYGMRFHPIKKRWLFHTGIDIGDNNLEKITAIANGIVTFVGVRGNYGKLVKIKHANGYESAYGHLNKISVKKGQRVTPKTTIGEVGNTGLSTGPHLHLEIKHNGKFINPKRFLKY